MNSAFSLSDRPRLELASLLGHLPPLPRIQRYYDSASGKNRTIEDYTTWTRLTLYIEGRTRGHDFGHISEDVLTLLRYAISDIFNEVDATTVSTALGNLKNCPITELVIVESLSAQPPDFRNWWIANCRPILTERKCGALKSVLRAFCRLAIGSWSDEYLDFISKLPSPSKDRYNVLLTGDCFVPIEHQGQLTDWLDELAASVIAQPGAIDVRRLREGCGAAINFQLGLRPVQIANIKTQDVTVRDSRVYVRVHKAKQRDKGPEYVIRRLKPEWAPLWIELGSRRTELRAAPHAHPDSFLRLPKERLSAELSQVITRVTGKRWTPNDFRHTGAQRLADAGASHAELQDYLMHETDGAANVYFEGSATQAEKVNRAMGLSAIYRGVATLARGGTVDGVTLASLAPDHQVGGIPHGIPIAGIGACQLGQSHCVKNPVLSCYGCRSFLPINEAGIHRTVAEGLRGVVREFYSVASDADASPAYGQLSRTIAAAESAAVQAAAPPQEESR